MSETVDIEAIESRVEACLDAVNENGSVSGRFAAWGMKGAGIIRNDVPALIKELRALRVAAGARTETPEVAERVLFASGRLLERCRTFLEHVMSKKVPLRCYMSQSTMRSGDELLHALSSVSSLDKELVTSNQTPEVAKLVKAAEDVDRQIDFTMDGGPLLTLYKFQRRLRAALLPFKGA